MDATDQAALVASGEVTPVELLDAAVERIERDDTAINAVVLRWFDHAREVAASPDLPDGPFRGVPFLLKDLFASMAGTPLTNGNKALAAAPTRVGSGHDARQPAAVPPGLVIAGRTNSPELGSLPVTEPEAYGPTRNPWNLDHTPGGSSGGSAAAVAAGMVPIAHASDGGGSIRIPAVVLRSGGAQGQPGADLAGSVARRARPRRRALREPHRPRHRPPARRHTRTRRRRHRVGPASRATVRRRGRRRSGRPADRAPRPPSARRVDPRRLRRRRPVRSDPARGARS